MDMKNMTDHGGMKHKMGGMHHMWMYFHSTIDDTVLFEFWTVKSVGSMIISCLILFLAGVGFEALKWSRLMVENRRRAQQDKTTGSNSNGHTLDPNLSFGASLVNRYRKQLFSGAHLIQTLLFSIQVLWAIC
uniref:Copper transport protein n=1 Tax=Ditylenchus dipsaci TaxID=166011 RepID=A0A915D7E5_9BILA